MKKKVYFYDVYRDNCRLIEDDIIDVDAKEYELKRCYGASNVVRDNDGNLIVLRTRA